MSQAEQEATSTDKPISNHPKNISEKGYRCVCLNARSIVNKKNELNIMVEDIDPHIIGITESWANIDITDAELGLTGYVMFRKDRIGRRGEGVILYVKESIQAYEIKLEREADCDKAVWCKIVSGNSKLTIGLVYRSPNINEEDNKGVDGIPPKLLMETVEQIRIPLARVFNLSLKEGVVPFEWKEANIIPLFKKGSRNKSENYRPVSLTSVICKLLERLIKDHMVDFLVKHKLLNSSQHGFLKARSCLTNMLCFLEEITKWIDVGSPVDIIYLDFQKAFDKVPHQRLLLKLEAHGIGDSITDWIEQWLTDRRQRVIVDGEVSNWKSVLSGVPQGSVLGPILFLIYINDLDDSITSNVLKFADDTKLFRKVNTDGDKQHLQNDLDRLVKWSEKWQMLFNFGKCKCLHTGHRNLNVNYKMGDTVLGTTVKEKDLGVTISADMKVSEQCGIAASMGNKILGLIRRNITYKGKKLIIPLYKAIVIPHLEYCIQAWRPYRKKDIDTLERIQRRATKMIPELRDLSYEERLKECGLTTLETRRLRGDQIEVFKILNGYENIDRNMFFSLKKDSSTRGHEVKLVKDQCRLDIRKHSFSQRTINEWNKLSTDCVTASSVNMFKNKVDTYLRRAGYK